MFQSSVSCNLSLSFHCYPKYPTIFIFKRLIKLVLLTRYIQFPLQVHQNLLTSQHSVLLSKKEGDMNGGLTGSEGDLSEEDSSGLEHGLVEQFSSLTNLHNETLARIMERHGQVRSRLGAWDAYRRDQARLLTWLKDTEKEKYKLQLRYIHVRLVPKTLNKIQVLLDKMPIGEAQAEDLREQQAQLLEFCDEALATSIRMEHAASTQRISNLQAGLETWRDFLLRILSLHSSFDQQTTQIQGRLNEIRQIACQPCPTSHAEIQATLDSLRVSLNICYFNEFIFPFIKKKKIKKNNHNISYMIFIASFGSFQCKKIADEVQYIIPMW